MDLARLGLSSLLNRKWLLIIVLPLFLYACDKRRVFEENKPIADNIWKANEPVKFEVDIEDSLSAYNFYMNIRHAEEYAFSNLFVFIKTEFPNGKAARDTVEFILQNPDGKWNGSGLGDIWDNQIMFKQNIRFPMKGKYSFSAEQAMRIPSLPMIMEIGMRIEKFEKE